MNTYVLTGQENTCGEHRKRSAGRFGIVLDTLLLWRARYQQRRHLRYLEDHILRDIGVDRLDALREASKPFWRE